MAFDPRFMNRLIPQDESEAEGMKTFSQGDLSGGGIVRMGTIVIDRKAAINFQDAPIVTP